VKIAYVLYPHFTPGTLRLAFRMLLGDRPVQMAARVNRHAGGARLRRARRALSTRRRLKRRPAAEPAHPW
jgi:hypothetical protein